MARRSSPGISEAKRSLARQLSGNPWFVGVGIANEGPGRQEIVVLVTESKESILKLVPKEWEGVRVRTMVGGIPRKQRLPGAGRPPE